LDDRFLQFLFTDWTVTRVKDLQQREEAGEKYPLGVNGECHKIVLMFVWLLIGYNW